MKPFKPPSPTLARASYAACRHSGTPPDLARVELDLPADVAERLERLFRAQSGGGGADAMRPRYARHVEHVEAVAAQGGYPVLRGRPR